MKALQWWMTLPGLVAGLTVAAPASATPASGTDVQILSKNVVDGTEYTVVRIIIAPGGGTGWHFHPGEIYGLVREGTLTHYDGGCVIDEVFKTGVPVTEGIGSGFVHNGRNLGSVPLVLDATYINPVGVPLSVDTPEPTGCPVP